MTRILKPYFGMFDGCMCAMCITYVCVLEGTITSHKCLSGNVHSRMQMLLVSHCYYLLCAAIPCCRVGYVCVCVVAATPIKEEEDHHEAVEIHDTNDLGI